jgi:hypothetical protein
MDSTPSPLDPELLLAHAGFVRSVARSLLRDGSAVDDVQQTWLTAPRGRRATPEPSSLARARRAQRRLRVAPLRRTALSA